MMQTPYIVDAIRTPMARGRAGGALADLHPVEILAHLLRTLVTRNRFDPGEVDDIIVGCVSQVGEQSNTPGRMAALAAGYPIHRSEEHTSELHSLMRISYAVFCL